MSTYTFINHIVEENPNIKYIIANDQSFHLALNKTNGFTMKWGKTMEEDPTHLPFGPEIADIEITKICGGIRQADGSRRSCPFCYKSNTNDLSRGYMSFETFKNIFDKITKNKTLTQIAFGTDASLLESANPDYWKIFDYCKANGVTPNVTVADIDRDTAKKMVNTFGAVAVSYYPMVNKNRCYDSVKMLIEESKTIDRHIDINIHAMVSNETIESIYELLEDYQNDSRLIGMNAIVFLSLKQKGRGEHFNRVSSEQFKKLIDKCFELNISFGMDSCSAPKFMEAISTKSLNERKRLEMMVESCESTLFSSFFDCFGTFYPCSFMEKTGNWKDGIDTLKITNFEDEVWNEPRVVAWRNAAIKRMKCNKGCNYCPFYNV